MNKHRPQVGVGVLIIAGNKVLLGRRSSVFNAHGIHTYGSCGGHLEFGETLEECAIRETKEESGLEVTKLTFLCVSNIIEYGKHYIDFEFLAEVKDAKTIVTGEMEDWKWYDLDDLPTPLFKPLELAIESYKTGEFYNP